MTTPRTFDRTNTGTLSKNTMKTKDTHPDARGKINIGGIWYWLSGWNKNNNQDQSKFVSLAVTEMTQEDVDRYCPAPRAQQAPQQAPQQTAPQQQARQTPVAQPINASNAGGIVGAQGHDDGLDDDII